MAQSTQITAKSLFPLGNPENLSKSDLRQTWVKWARQPYSSELLSDIEKPAQGGQEGPEMNVEGMDEDDRDRSVIVGGLIMASAVLTSLSLAAYCLRDVFEHLLWVLR